MAEGCRAIGSITMGTVTIVVAVAFLSSLLIVLGVSAACTSLTVGALCPIILPLSAVPAILVGSMIAVRIGQGLTRRKTAHDERISLATIDGLTGLLNRPGFDAVATEVFAETRSSGKPASALVCDIDAFRNLNARYGHEAGDRALRYLAELLEEAIGRRPAILGRQGDDEFVILLPGVDLKEAAAIAEGLRESSEARAFVQQDRAAKFTVSVGVGTEASGASELGRLLRQNGSHVVSSQGSR